MIPEQRWRHPVRSCAAHGNLKVLGNDVTLQPLSAEVRSVKTGTAYCAKIDVSHAAEYIWFTLNLLWSSVYYVVRTGILLNTARTQRPYPARKRAM